MKSKIVLQSDFGLADGAVATMIGVCLSVDPTLEVYNSTHEITTYNIFEASYRLLQVFPYLPEGSVFVSVVDPGVGTTRKSLVVKTNDNKYIVTPNNGTLTHIHNFIGIKEVREIYEETNRRKNSEFSYTFHGRDVYAYTAARLASGIISYEEVGPSLALEEIYTLPVVESEIGEDYIKGAVDILDVRFGSLWTSIRKDDFKKLNPEFFESFEVSISKGDMLVYQNRVKYAQTFGDVRVGSPILYVNSLDCMALAINQGSFAKAYNIGVGKEWIIEIRKLHK